MWHAARRSVRLAAFNASTASVAPALRGDAVTEAANVAVSMRAGASAFARKLDRPQASAFSCASHAALAARRASACPSALARAPPLALCAARELLHSSSLSSGEEKDGAWKDDRKKKKDGKDKKSYGNDSSVKNTSGGSFDGASNGVDGASEVLSPNTKLLTELVANAKAVAVREDLEALASFVSPDGLQDPTVEPKTHLTVTEFDALLAEHGFDTEAKRRTVTRAFCDAGVVVKFEDIIYLNGAQVTKDVLRSLPVVPSSVYGLDPKTLTELEMELATLKIQVDAAAARARRRSNVIVFGGLLALCAQLAMFMRLTYVELSWDVMEPISYFVGVFNAILVYIYFMVNKRDFSFDDWSNRMQKYFWTENITRNAVDYAKYAKVAKRLRKRITR
jgi:hypothetical protein